MNNYIKASLLLLIAGAWQIRAEMCNSYAPVEFVNQRSDIQVVVHNLGSKISTEVPVGGYQTVGTLCQTTGEPVQEKYSLILKKEGLPAVTVELFAVLAPSNIGTYKIMDIPVPQNSLIGYAGPMRAIFYGNWGMGASQKASHKVMLSDGTKVIVTVEVIFESFYRKFKFYVQY